MTKKQPQSIKSQVIAALSHPEGEEGLYLDNFYLLHELEERPIVSGSQLEILDALKELIEEGVVVTEDGERGLVFRLKS